MIQKNAEFSIDNGPSKLDLMLSLFDTDMGTRMVKFHTPEWVHTHDSHEFSVEIISAMRRTTDANAWDIMGITENTDAQGERTRVSIYYLSNLREGVMRFEEKLRTHGIMETPDDSKRARAFMIVIEKMIATYQNSHPGNLNEEIFRLYEKSKRVKFAKDRDSLTEAIQNI